MSRACDDAMREDELVEALAKRLWSTYWQAGGDDQHGPGGDGEKIEPWQALARECLRQMEWAHEATALFCTEAVVKGDCDPNDWKLTLAPDDWQP